MALTPKRLFLSFSLFSCLSLFSAFFLALTIGSKNIFIVWNTKTIAGGRKAVGETSRIMAFLRLRSELSSEFGKVQGAKRFFNSFLVVGFYVACCRTIDALHLFVPTSLLKPFYLCVLKPCDADHSAGKYPRRKSEFRGAECLKIMSQSWPHP